MKFVKNAKLITFLFTGTGIGVQNCTENDVSSQGVILKLSNCHLLEENEIKKITF